MKFKYCAFIENTPEMRVHLESIGYIEVDKLDCPCYFIVARNGKYSQSPISPEFMKNLKTVSCLGNPSLFKAVTAVRDDSDKGKYFIDSEGRFVECQREMIKEFIDRAFITGYDISDLREATLEELIEHFKK